MKITRRHFLRATVATAVAFPTIIPRHVLGGPKFVPPSEKINLAIVGVGGQGRTNLKALLPHGDAQVMAIADPAQRWDLTPFYYKGEAGRGPIRKLLEDHYSTKTPNYRVAEFEDFRVMLEKEKSIDAVLCATPDHLHAYVTAFSLRAGKHTFCEKPLTHNLWEARLISQIARETGLATQMGNIGHSTEGIRQTVEFLHDGAIGTVREVHSWVPATRWNPTLHSTPTDSLPVPSGLNWDLWIGPRQMRAYHSAYAPVTWRDFWTFGCGALGDFGCHDMDSPTWAFDLPSPESVEVLRAGYGDAEIAPYGEIGYYQFPAHGKWPAIKLTWYSGGLQPPRPDALPPGASLPSRGVLFVGEKGVIQCGGAGGPPNIFPESLRASYKIPAPTLARSKGHHRDWLDAIKGGPAASASFEYAARLTETTLLGVLSLRLGGKKIYWDAANLKAKGLPEADPLIKETYRPGWEPA